MIDLQREICKPGLKLDFTAHGITEYLSEFGLSNDSSRDFSQVHFMHSRTIPLYVKNFAYGKNSKNFRLERQPAPLCAQLSNEHRVHKEWQLPPSRRTFHRDGKISPAWCGRGGGVHALPLSLCLPSRAKLWCTLQLRGQIRSPYFTRICTLHVVMCIRN